MTLTTRKLPESTPLMLSAVEGCEASPLEIPSVRRPVSGGGWSAVAGLPHRPTEVEDLACFANAFV